MSALYLLSTPLHLFVASGVARARSGTGEPERARALFVDQARSEDHPYAACLEAWSASPFESVHVLPARPRRALAKPLYRRRQLAVLAEHVGELRPARVFGGNDRRVEFQGAVRAARALDPAARGAYLDEGAFTYEGRPTPRRERLVDEWLKRLAYGGFYRTPETVGASVWTDEAWVAFPEHVHPAVAARELHRVPSEWFQGPAMEELGRRILERFAVDASSLDELDVLLTTPHAKVLAREPRLVPELRAVVDDLLAAGLVVGVKAHPRSGGDPLGVADRVRTVPAGACFEALLPLLRGTTVVAEGVSTLLTTRWLRADLRAVGLADEVLGGPPARRRLLDAIGVELRAPAGLGLRLAQEAAR